jgi:hypothetical protein
MIRRRLRLFAVTATAVAGLTVVGYATDGVIEISQARALAGNVTPGDTPGFPVTISQSGSYRLTSNLFASSAADAIGVGTSFVTIDLNGFEIKGANGPCVICGTNYEVVILNGLLLVESGRGIGVGDNSRVEGVHVSHKDGAFGIVNFGIEVGRRSIVTRCIVDNFSAGISAGSGSVVSFNTVGDSFRGLLFSAGPVGFVGNNLQNNTTNVTGGISLGPNICGDAVCP